jgi:hypothetical protein
MRYPCHMNTELQKETMSHEVELPDACAVCDGPITVRFTPTSARGVCLACHLVTALTMARAGEGVRISHLPGGNA